MTHTRGPWRLDGDANAMNLDVVSGDGRIAMLDCENFEVPTDELKANAALIAAAPELLEALQEAVNKGYMWDNDPELWSKASAAIAKAKGN